MWWTASRPRWHMMINIISIKKEVWVLALWRMLSRVLGVFLGQAEGEVAVCSIKHIGMFTPSDQLYNYNNKDIVLKIVIYKNCDVKE